MLALTEVWKSAAGFECFVLNFSSENVVGNRDDRSTQGVFHFKSRALQTKGTREYPVRTQSGVNASGNDPTNLGLVKRTFVQVSRSLRGSRSSPLGMYASLVTHKIGSDPAA